jgi:hypothetical protein
MDSPWGNTPWQPQLFSADEQVLPINAEAEQQRSVAVIDVPSAAIAGA